MWSLQERIGSQQDFYYELIKKINFDLRCAAPAIIKEFDSATQTVTAQLVIKERIISNGIAESKKIPVLYKVPIYMPRAGNFIITLPIAVGDECLVVFADTNFDAWQQNGGEENEQMTQRRHDLTDAIALCGIWSQKRLIDDYSPTDLEIRSLDNTISLTVSKSGITLTSPSTTIDSPDTYVTGNFSTESGATGSFLSYDGKLVTVTNGIVTEIVG
jgi:hypothetical protein